MANVEDVIFNSTFKVLVCKRHGSGVHPTKTAVKRHLRGEGHRSGGETLKRAIADISKLPLGSLEAVLDATPPVDSQPVAPPIPHLRVWNGWSCTSCEGRFLSTSLELLQRHASSQHGRRRGEQPLWEACKLQTFFSETKDRRYFRVASLSGVTPVTNHEDRAYENNACECCQSIQTYCGHSLGKELIVNRERTYGPNSPTISMCTKDNSSTTLSTTNFSALQDFRFEAWGRPSSPVQSITLLHPFTECAAKYVRLPVHRIDDILKSEAFLSATHPIFDGSHIDSALNMRTVFPQSQEEPVFINALLYATVQLLNRGNPTVEGLSLQSKTLRLLQGKINSPSRLLSPSVVGAIMLLKATAYKTGDKTGHVAHSAGLANALDISVGNGTVLTPAARRAIFWLNLSAALVMDCKRDKSVEHSQAFIWQGERVSHGVRGPPIGFERHRDSLPEGLLGCIADTVELRSFLRQETMALSSQDVAHDQVDPMQTSIESRLASLGHVCQNIGVIAEAVRLGVFMCCYCIWMETWNDSLIPCKLAAKLLDLLEPTAVFGPENPTSIWLQHMDLLLWLLLVGSSVVELDRGQVEGLRLRQSHLISSVFSAHRDLGEFNSTDLKRDLEFALHDFMYEDGWLQQRRLIKDWSNLECSINNSID